MTKIEAETLELAYSNAASRLKCSVTDLEIEVIQNPTKGLAGFFKKNAIIVARCMANDENRPQMQWDNDDGEKKRSHKLSEKFIPKKPKIVEESIHKISESMPHAPQSVKNVIGGVKKIVDSVDVPKPKRPAIVDQFFSKESVDIHEVAIDIKAEIGELFEKSCFKLDKIDVSVYDENTLLIEFDGEDAALLIGKEGYRYKALSYMLYNWINSTYNFQVRLEIASFLENQEEMIARYLDSIHEYIEKDGRAQTKVLDGVLVQIALKELRRVYSDKYVGVRTTRDGGKYIIVNDFQSRN